MNSRNACRFAGCALLAIAVFSSGPALLLGQGAGGRRAPVPSADAQNKVLALIRDVFKKEYKQAKTPDRKVALAAELFKRGVESKDPTERFVLLRVARDMAALAGEANTACRAIDEMARRYQVDPSAMKREALAKAAKGATLPKHHKAVAEQAASLMEDAMVADDYPMAGQLAQTALAAAREARDPALMGRIAARSKEIDQVAKARGEVKEALASLEKNPGDPKANLAVGRYYCLVKGDWSKGLPMLALGSDGTLDVLAKKELVGVTTSDAQVALADGWWALIEEHEGLAQRQLRVRAAHWYEEALPELSGLTKMRVQKRLVAIEAAQRSDEPEDTKPAKGDPKVVRRKKPSFAGRWRDRFGSVIEFKVEDRKVLGVYKNVDNSYGYEWVRYDGRIVGKVSRDGRTLTGQWARSPTYTAPEDGGVLLFKLSKDGTAFVGTYCHGDQQAGAWTGVRIK